MSSADKIQSEYSVANGLDFEPFFDLSPSEYYGLVTDGINLNNLEMMTRKLEFIDLPQGVLIAVVGSDGKLEQHCQSKTELIVIQNTTDLDGDTVLREFFGKKQYAELFDAGPGGVIDVKVLEEDTPLSYAFSDSDTLYPDRTLNMFPIYPTTQDGLELFFRAREKTLVEMSTDKRIKRALKSQLQSYRRSMTTGEHRRIPIFDTDKSLQYYCEAWPAYSTGFKAAYLRTTQRKLDLLTLRLEETKEWGAVAREMPTSTLGRLDYLAQEGIISEKDASSTSEAYAWFLQQYHHIQENYKQGGEHQHLSLPYDPVLFKEYHLSIEQFSNL